MMNKSDAKKIAQSGKVSWGEMQSTLKRAYEAGATDERRATVNKSFSKATSYNIMCGYAKEYEADRIINARRYGEWIGAVHILREFGDFYEGWRPEPPAPKDWPPPQHQEPIKSPF